MKNKDDKLKTSILAHCGYKLEDNKLTSISKKENTPSVLDPEILAYCGYKLEGNKLVPTFYNPNPYE